MIASMTFPRRLRAHIKSLLRHPADYLATYITFRSSTDLERWQVPTNLRPDWDERTQLVATLIPDGSKVIEFGAARLVLPRYLGPGCTYQPSDLVKRSEDTLELDLNEALPLLQCRYDYAVFSGVLEYVQDLDRLMRWLPGVTDKVIFSYAITDFLSDPISRRRHGWINSLSDSEVRQLINLYELELMSTERWQGQIIYKCHFLTRSAEAQPGKVQGWT